MPGQIDAATTATYIHAIIQGELEVPAPILDQAQYLLRALQAMDAVPE